MKIIVPVERVAAIAIFLPLQGSGIGVVAELFLSNDGVAAVLWVLDLRDPVAGIIGRAVCLRRSLPISHDPRPVKITPQFHRPQPAPFVQPANLHD